MEDDLNFTKTEDDLNFFINGRRPQFFQKWKTTSIFGEREDNLKFWENGRQSKYFPPLLNSKPNPPILGLCTAQVMCFFALILASPYVGNLPPSAYHHHHILTNPDTNFLHFLLMD